MSDDARTLSQRWYPESRIGGFSSVDGTVAFYTRIAAVLEPSFVVLDLGCGRGAAAEDPVPWRRELQTLRGRCARVIGVDVDPTAEANPLVDDFRLIAEGPLPVDDASIDLCVADAVVEHVEDIRGFFAECRRVVRPGGYLFLRTPNKWGYVGLASRIVPNDLHTRVLRKVQQGRKDEDVFPTLYRCNTRRALVRALDAEGFDAVVTAHEPEPSYLSFSSVAYGLGVLFQRYAPPALRHSLIVSARRRP